MAAARPIVFSGDPHNNPVKDAQAGITLPPEDPAEIAIAVASLAALPASERWSMGLRGRRYVEEHHDFGRLGDRLERVLQLALAGSTSAQSSPGLGRRRTAA
jgi:glycosyltransferase involved in cell wall biosynthesis